MKIMIYAPHSAIWPHAFPEALVAEALVQQGNEVVYVGCGRQFRGYCVAMSAFGLGYDSSDQQKEAICQKCERSKTLIRQEFGLKGTDIAQELSEDDIQHVEDILGGITPNNYLALEFSGIKVGRLALYEFLLNHKKNNLDISLDQWPEYRVLLRNSIYSTLASMRIIEREKPDRLITYNSFYSVNHVCCMVADRFSVPHYLLHAGSNMAHRLETLTLSRGYSYNFITRSPLWSRYQNIPCSTAQLSVVTDHLLALFEANSVFVYSAPKSRKRIDLKRRFGITIEQKVLVATMSSHDERFAAVTIGVMPPDRGSVFSTQIDWIDALAEFVSRRPELFLIIRVHPREFPNKRESVTSEYASKLKAQLSNLPENAKVNWPSDRISLYDIADIGDVFLNSRSTTGMEVSLLGLPVVIYSPNQLYSYVPDLNYVADSKGDYFSQIDRALSHGWDIEFSRKAFRWGVFQHCRSTIDISESYRGDKPQAGGLAAMWVRRIVRKMAPRYQQKQDCRRRAQRLKSGKALNDYLETGKDSIVELDRVELEPPLLGQETDALQREFRRIYAAMYQGDANVEPESLQDNILKFIGQVRFHVKIT
ncbi:MAG: hypothetical protein ACYCXT_13690 [Acidiferrobacteraceae bacterium]